MHDSQGVAKARHSTVKFFLLAGHCVLNVVSKIEPGLSLARGRVLRNLHQPTLKLAKLNLKEKRIGMPDFMRITKQSIKNMREAVRCMEDFDVASSGSEVTNNCSETACKS